MSTDMKANSSSTPFNGHVQLQQSDMSRFVASQYATVTPIAPSSEECITTHQNVVCPNRDMLRRSLSCIEEEPIFRLKFRSITRPEEALSIISRLTSECERLHATNISLHHDLEAEKREKQMLVNQVEIQAVQNAVQEGKLQRQLSAALDKLSELEGLVDDHRKSDDEDNIRTRLRRNRYELNYNNEDSDTNSSRSRFPRSINASGPEKRSRRRVGSASSEDEEYVTRKRVSTIVRQRTKEEIQEFRINLDEYNVDLTPEVMKAFHHFSKELLKYFSKATDVSGPFLEDPLESSCTATKAKWESFCASTGRPSMCIRKLKDRAGTRPNTQCVYKSFREFFADIELMLNNARECNDKGIDDARKFEKRLAKKMMESKQDPRFNVLWSK